MHNDKRFNAIIISNKCSKDSAIIQKKNFLLSVAVTAQRYLLFILKHCFLTVIAILLVLKRDF